MQLWARALSQHASKKILVTIKHFVMHKKIRTAFLLTSTIIILFSCSKSNTNSSPDAQGIHFKIDGIQYDLTYDLTVTTTPTSDSIHVMAFDASATHYAQIFIITKSGKPGMYSSTSYTAAQGGCSFAYNSYAAAAFWAGSVINYNLTGFSTASSSSEGNANVQGTFSGTVLNNDNTLHALTNGTFNIHQ
jgi:hypothetical protein